MTMANDPLQPEAEPDARPDDGAELEMELELEVEEVVEGRAGAVGDVAEESSSGHDHRPVTCPVAWCPICLAVSAASPVQPELVEHLLKAGSELLLAMRAVIDVRGREVDPSSNGSSTTPLEKIDLG